MIETRKAHELDIVELTEDLPEYDLKCGERGTVVEVFHDPEEAYMLEFVDDSGTSSKLADWVKSDQIVNIYSLAKGYIEEGIRHFNNGDSLAAEKYFQLAVELTPQSIGALHISVMTRLADSNNYPQLITALRTLLRIAPHYEAARNNLAIAFQRYGIQKEAEGDTDATLELLHLAILVASAPDISASIKRSFSVVFTKLAAQAYQANDISTAYRYMTKACETDPNETTRRNLAMAYVESARLHLAQNNLSKAVDSFERAFDSGLYTPELLNDYGVALARVGRFEDAAWQLEKALKLVPDEEIIRTNLNLVIGTVTKELRLIKVEPAFELLPIIQAQDFRLAA